MISQKTENTDVSELSDESLSEALNEAFQKYNLYSNEQRKRKRVKYEIAQKEFNIARKNLSDVCDFDKTFEFQGVPFALLRPTLSRFFN